MNRSAQWIAAALGVVLLTSLSARILSDQPLVSESFQTSLFGVDDGPETLTVIDHEALPLKIGTSVELHRFDIDAGFPYTLRYLSFDVEMSDLQIHDWTVYEVEKDHIDYSNKVAQGESLSDGWLKLRFYSDRSRAYFGEGKQSFSLVATVMRDGENPNLSLSQANLDEVTDFFDWDWLEGHLDDPWSEL